MMQSISSVCLQPLQLRAALVLALFHITHFVETTIIQTYRAVSIEKDKNEYSSAVKWHFKCETFLLQMSFHEGRIIKKNVLFLLLLWLIGYWL